MRQVSNTFKEAIKKYGKQIDVIITYTENGIEKILDTDTIFSVTPIVSGNLLKSVMKQLNFESIEKVEKYTWINVQFGVLTDLQIFEYVDLGDYLIAEEPEYNADTLSYSHKCFDKMIYSMKDYESLNVTYPTTIKNYLNALANKIGLTLKQSNFYNQNMQIQAELYEGLGYKYRDVLDEIAQATGSIICIDSNNELEVRYLNETNEIIDEDYLKDINVEFGEKYGAINTIVLSRSAGADNIYYPQPLPQNPCEIKIQDNQIMNWNDRADYLPELYQALNGIEYYINDFKSTGIIYLEIGDVFNVQIGENTYKCVLLNDEIDITQGLEEQIYTDRPEQSETDYSKADKTDMRINQTYLIVDKQNQTIESVVSNVNTQNNKISQVTQTVDELNQKIQDIADITIAGETTQARLTLEGINQSEPISVNIHPISVNISYLYPRNNLYPSDTLYMTNRKLRFIRHYEENGETLTQNIDYTIPDDLLYYDSNNYDEFILNYDTQTCQVRKKCKYNTDGTVGLLVTEVTTDYPYPQILLDDGDYEIELLGYNIGYVSVRLMAQNIYTSQFATKVEMNSAITQTAEEINLEVSKKVGNNEVISKINQSAEAVTINANKIGLQANDVLNILSGNTINLTSKNLNISSNNFNVDKNGNLSCRNASVIGSITSNNAKITGGQIVMEGEGSNTSLLRVTDVNNTSNFSYIQPGGAGFVGSIGRVDIQAQRHNFAYSSVGVEDSEGKTSIRGSGITTPSVTQTSLESEKKNFEKFKNALEVLKNIDIYKYNLKNEENNTKKHIGFVIGQNFNYSKEVTSTNNDGVDIYSFVSLCCKAIQEQQEQIEQLKQEISNLKGGKK